MKQGGIAAVAWAPYEERTENYARHLNASLYNIHYLRYKRPLLAPIKYVPQCLKTWDVLRRQRPSAVYVMNPPVFAAWSVYRYCRISGASLIMDTHPPALYSGKWAWTVPLQRALAKRALVNIVDQDRYNRLFESWGAKTLTLRHPQINIHRERLKDISSSNQFSVTVVSTFSEDEPLDVVIAAAHRLPDIRFFILGDTAKAKKALLKSAPDNVTFPGYLVGDDYWNQLYSSRAVMALTTWPYSLMMGAEEGMALGKPLLLSRQPVLTEHFTKGTVFVDHSVDSMVAGVLKLQKQESTLIQEIVELAAEKQRQWEAAFQKLQTLIRSQSCTVC